MTEVKDKLFLDKIKIADNGCWIWIGSLSHNGYGQLKRRGIHYRAHRYSYELYKGKIEENMIVMHICDNPQCVNPQHLRLGTNKDNAIDCKNKGRLNTSKGQRHVRAKLTNKQVADIRDTYKVGIKQKALASKYKVRQDTISRIVNNKVRK